MKKIILLLAIVIVTSTAMFAQKEQNGPRPLDPQKREQIFNARVQAMQKQLKLTPEQTQKFIPLYKSYLDEIHSLKFPKRNVSPKDINEAYSGVMSQLKFKKNIISIQEKYVGKMRNILNPQQLTQFLKVESNIQHSFKAEKDRRGHQGQGHGPRGMKNKNMAPCSINFQNGEIKMLQIP